MVRNGLGTWLWTLLRGRPHSIMPSASDPYLLRWFLLPRNKVVNVYLHKWMHSDDDRAMHDHPWWFLSLILKGNYTEVTPEGAFKRRAGTIAYRPATWRHQVELEKDEEEKFATAWSVIVTGPVKRNWGFWCGTRFVAWEDFTAVDGSGGSSRGCGEA